MFKQMSMSHFKSWRETDAVRLAPLTGFFGANSSGKSSLLQMLLLLKQTAESNDRSLALKTGSIQEGYVNLGAADEIIHGDGTEMTLGMAWELPSKSALHIPMPEGTGALKLNELSFETTIHAEAQKVHVKSLRYWQDESFAVQLSRKPNNHYTIHVDIQGQEPRRPQSRPRVYMRPEKCYGFSNEALRFYQNTDYLRDIEFEFERQFQRLHYLGPLREYPKRIYAWSGERPGNVGLKGELAVPALLAGKNQKVYKDGRRRYSRLEARIAKWLVDLGLAASFRPRPLFEGSSQYAVWLKRHEHSPEVLIADLGIGVSQVLPALTLCYYVPQGSTIILEQPELHLHPSVQAGLADVFIDVIKNRDVQIILESHSEHLLRRLQLRLAEEEIAPDDIALYFCELRDGMSHLKPLNVDMFGDIHNWPVDFFGDLLGDMVKTADAGLNRKIEQANAS